MHSDIIPHLPLTPRTPTPPQNEYRFYSSPRTTLTPGFLIKAPHPSYPIAMIEPSIMPMSHGFPNSHIQHSTPPFSSNAKKNLENNGSTPQLLPPASLLPSPSLYFEGKLDSNNSYNINLPPSPPSGSDFASPVPGIGFSRSMGLLLFTPEYIANLPSVEILRLTSQCMPVNSVIIPPSPLELQLRGNLESPRQWRAIHIDGLPSSVTYADLMPIIGSVKLEFVRLTSDYERGTVRFELRFLSYIDALRFYAVSLINPVEFVGHLTTVSWALVPPISGALINSIKNGATRKLQIFFNDSEDMNGICEYLQENLSRFGPIEKMYPLTDEKTNDSNSYNWIVIFASLEGAIQANLALNKATAKVNCTEFVPYSDEDFHVLEQQAALLYLNESPYETKKIAKYSRFQITEALSYQYLAAVLTAQIRGGVEQTGNRCICISKLPQSTKLLDICNIVRGGMLESVRAFMDLNVCFVTFIEPSAAAQFWATYQMKRLNVNGERVRIGWGRNPGPLAPEIKQVVSQGVTRNICLKWLLKTNPFTGNDGGYNELERTFSPFGTIEQIRIAQDVSCTFISFTDIKCAIQAVNWARDCKIFANVSVQYGKDRCATLPRSTAKDTEPSMIQFLRRSILRMWNHCNQAYGRPEESHIY